MQTTRIAGALGLLCLAALLAGPGCAGGDGGQDAGPDARDGGEDGDARDGGDDGDGEAPALWPWCPAPSAYQGGSWDHAAQVDDGALYCVLNQGATVEEDLGAKARLRIVPGSYPLPAASGQVDLLLPVCLELPGGQGSELSGPGPLAVTAEPYHQGRRLTWRLEQPLLAGGRSWAFELFVTLYTYDAAAGLPILALSDRLMLHEPWGELYLSFRLGHAELGYPWPLLPCLPANSNRRVERVTFDRGWLEVWHDVVHDAEYGGGGPAILSRGFGALDGVAFDQQDYYKLGHLIAHHNWGGTFLVMFDEPVGSVCGLKLCVPSQDGGGPDPGAWAMGCDLQPIEELAGLVLEP
jgi:hypothetical protein